MACTCRSNQQALAAAAKWLRVIGPLRRVLVAYRCAVCVAAAVTYRQCAREVWRPVTYQPIGSNLRAGSNGLRKTHADVIVGGSP